jgi:dTDP-4-amino-4,6-dideoxygalactose transaminase
LIEDAAESLGAKIGNKKVGTFGEAAMFSFCAPKVITTGEGGAVVTNSKDIYEKLKLIRSHGRAETENYFSSTQYMDYLTLGYNFRMSNITAALGITQLKKIEKIIKLRRQKVAYLTKKLRDLKEILLPIPPKNYFHLYQMYTIRIKDGMKIRDALKNYLNRKGIMAKVYYYPVHLTYFYKKKLKYKLSLPITEKISEQVLTLPMYPTLTKKEMDYIVKEIKNFYKNEL